MQNAGLRNAVKKNNNILIKAVAIATFLTEEYPHKRTQEWFNDLFYGLKKKNKFKPEHFIEWGRVGFLANKRLYTSKMKARGTDMMMAGYTLNHLSGTYEFYNPNTDSIIISNSVKWKDLIGGNLQR